MRFLLKLLLVALPLMSRGQQEVLNWSNPFDDRKGFRPSFVNTITDRERNEFVTALVNQNSIQRFYQPHNKPSVKLLNQFSASDSAAGFYRNIRVPNNLIDLYWKNSFVGGLMYKGRITEVLRHRRTYDFLVLETDVNTGSTVPADTIKSSFNERIISCYSYQQQLYLLTYEEGKSSLLIYTKRTGEPLRKQAVSISLKGLGASQNGPFASRLNEFSDFFRRGAFAVYENNLRYPALFHSVRNKIYLQKQQVVFTINSNDLNTYVLTVDLDKGSYRMQQFDQHPGVEKNLAHASTTSILVDSILVTAYNSNNRLQLSVFNILSEQKLFEHTIHAENIDSIATLPVQKTGSFWSKSDVEGTELKKFFDKSATNPLSLSGYRSNGKMFLSFAVPYKQPVNATSLLNLVMSAAGTYFVNAPADSYGFFLVGFSGVSTDTYIGFNSSLNYPELQFSTEDANLSVWEKMKMFVQLKGLDPKRCDFFYLDGFFYVGFYDSMNDRFSISRFNEKGIDP